MAETSFTRRIMVGAGWLIAFRIFSRTAGMISTLVLARLLVPADFGLLAMATAFSAAVEALSALGLDQALIHWQEKGEKLYDTAFTVQLGRALLTGGMIALGAGWAAQWFGEPRLETVVLVLGALSALAGLENIGTVEFRRDLRFDRQFRLLAVPRLVQVLTTISLAWITHSYWALLVGLAVMRIGRLVMTYVMHPYRPRLSLRGWRDLIGFSFWTWLSAVTAIAWNRMDPFVLGHLFSPGDLAMYVFAMDLAMLPVNELLMPSLDVLFPGFASKQAQGGNALNEAPVIAAAMTLAFAPVAILLSAAGSDMVVVLFGARWAAAAPLVEILGFLALICPTSYVASTVLVACGLVRSNFIPIAVMVLPKVIVVYLAALTHDLRLVAWCNMALVVVECGLLVIVTTWHGAPLREAGRGLFRASIAVGITLAFLFVTGIGWTDSGRGFIGAVFHGTGVAVVTFALYSAILAALWGTAGRPAGPETFILRVLRQLPRIRPSAAQAN